MISASLHSHPLPVTSRGSVLLSLPLVVAQVFCAMAHLNYVTEFYPDISYPERMSISKVHHQVTMLNRSPFTDFMHHHHPLQNHPHHSLHHPHHSLHHPHHLLHPPVPTHQEHQQRYDTKLPDNMSRQRRLNRFKTQPVTFDEIKEVDEDDEEREKSDEDDGEGDKAADKAKQRAERLKSHFAAFSKTMEELVNIRFDEETAERQQRLFQAKRAQRSKMGRAQGRRRGEERGRGEGEERRDDKIQEEIDEEMEGQGQGPHVTGGEGEGLSAVEEQTQALSEEKQKQLSLLAAELSAPPSTSSSAEGCRSHTTHAEHTEDEVL